MSPQQIAEAARTIRTGYGTRRDFTDPRTATPEHECPNCENILYEGETCSCQAEDDEAGFDDDDCPDCNGTGEMAFGHRCDHGRTRLHVSRPYRRLDPDEI